jgi:hypothetical protein
VDLGQVKITVASCDRYLTLGRAMKLKIMHTKSNADIAREIIEHRLKISRDKNLPKEKGITMLDCPYSDKDRVKALGAKWNGTLKSWYITKRMDADLFRQWIKSGR